MSIHSCRNSGEKCIYHYDAKGAYHNIGIYDKEVLDIQIEKAIKENKFFKKKQEEKCNHCPWWYYCQGGCSSRNRYLEKDGFVDITECCINNVVYPQLIEWILDGYIN